MPGDWAPIVDRTDPDVLLDAELVDGDPDPEPPLFCDRHPNDTEAPCGPCAGWRRAHERWERRHPSPPPKSKLRAWAEFVEELRAAEQRAEEARAADEGEEPPLEAIEAKAAPAAKPRPKPPGWVPGPNGQPRCRRHAHLPFAPARCDGCRDAETAAGESA